ncbi:MAG: nicotinate-nucleotide diphosphorylase (carboxylating), partial [SAR324 cluster bacterium]|nr:nicotinate-nucleotide diphosphorylase (carboxylating) [SAR324 cluster bacterium]
MEKAVHFDLDEIIKHALEEDIGDGDITTESILSKDIVLEGAFIAKEKGVIAGLRVARKTFQFLDANAQLESYVEDGNLVNPGDIFASIRGQGQALLGAERTALNFLQRMSG